MSSPVAADNGIPYPSDPLAQRVREIGRVSGMIGAIVLAGWIVTEMGQNERNTVATLAEVLKQDLQQNRIFINSLGDTLETGFRLCAGGRGSVSIRPDLTRGDPR